MASKSTYWQTLIPLLVYLQLEQHIPIYQAGRQGADGYIYFVPNRHFGKRSHTSISKSGY